MAEWVRLDVGYFTNAKILRAGPEAALLHLASICYLGDQNLGTGLLPGEAVPLLVAAVKARRPPEVIERLVKFELWHPSDDGAYIVHDYIVKNGDESDAAKARARQQKHRDRIRDNT